MYGVLVGKAQQAILTGGLISTANVKHAANDFNVGQRKRRTGSDRMYRPLRGGPLRDTIALMEAWAPRTTGW